MTKIRTQPLANCQRVVLDVLSVIAVLAAIFTNPVQGFSATKNTSGESQTSAPAVVGNIESAQPTNLQPLPDDPDWPFARLVTVLILGALFSFFRLLNRFHRFWHLGVITNGYAAAYIAFGMIPCLIAYFAGYQVDRHAGSPSWVSSAINLTGIAAAYFAPVVSLRSRKVAEDEDQVDALPFPPTTNMAYECLEEKIRDCIRNRLHKRVKEASLFYDWDTIKLAGRQALELEKSVSGLNNRAYNKAIKHLNSCPSDTRSNTDIDRKYNTLFRLLCHCQFRHLFKQLSALKAEGIS